MKYFFPALISLSLMLHACDGDGVCLSGLFHPDEEHYSLSENIEFNLSIDTFSYQIDSTPIIDTIYTYESVNSSKLVAIYSFSAADCSQVMDDEYAYHVSFEINPFISNFYIEGDSLQSIDCHFAQYGFIYGSGAHPVKTGYIEGKKINGEEWYIEFELTPEPIFEGEIVPTIYKTGTYQY